MDANAPDQGCSQLLAHKIRPFLVFPQRAKGGLNLVFVDCADREIRFWMHVLADKLFQLAAPVMQIVLGVDSLTRWKEQRGLLAPLVTLECLIQVRLQAV